MHRITKVLGIIAILVLLTGVAQAGDWPMAGHDPQHNSIADESVQPPLELVWKTYIAGGIGGIGSFPVISGGTVYTGSWDGHVYALNATTGREIWRHKIGGGIYSSLALSHTTAYVGAQDGYLYALDATTGSEIWKYKAGDSYVSSPVVSGSTVYVGSDKGAYALDTITGTKKWKYETSIGCGSPAVSWGIVYIGSYEHVYALDAGIGTEKWKHKSGGIDHEHYTPTVSEGMVYIGSSSHYLYALDTDTGMEKWKYKTSDRVISCTPALTSPAVSEGMVYIGTWDGYVYALDAVTGIKNWEYETEDGINSAPAVSDGTVYIGSRDSCVYALDAVTGIEKWNYKTGNRICSSPAISGGIVYIGSGDNYMYAFAKTPVSTPAPTAIPIPTSTPAPFPSADTDTLLDGEWAEIQVSLPRGLSENDCFQIEIKTSTGGTSAIEVTVPGVIDPDPATGLLPPWSSSAASDGFSTDTGVGRSADGEHMTHYMFHLQPWYPTKSINLNEMALTYTDEEVSVGLAPMGDKPLEGKEQWNYRKVDGYTPYPTPAPMPAPTAAPTIAPTPAPISPYSTFPPSSIIGAAAVIVIILIAVVGISRKRKKGKSTKPQPPAEPPKPKTEPVKQKTAIKKETPPPISESLTIERAIYDPCKRDFVEERLPRMKDWIERHDPGVYWFALSIQNNTDKAIDEWGVDLEFSSALKIKDAKIEGIEIEIPHETHLGLFKISVPKEYGIVIPQKGAQRVYFKLRADKPKTTYEISGVFKSEITGDVPIRTKEFKYLCDTGVSAEAVKVELKKTFSEKEAARLALSFKTVQELDRMCDREAKTDEYRDKLLVLKNYTEGFSDTFTNQVGEFSRFMKEEQSGYLDDEYKGKVRRFCTNLVDMWISEFLKG